MLLLKNLFLVLTIPLASLKSSTIFPSGRFALLIFLFIVFINDTNVQILGGLFQTLNIYYNILLSFTSIKLKDNFLETLENSGNTNPSKLDIKVWLINNKPVKLYLDSNESKKIIYNDNNNKSGIYLWLNNVNNNYYVGSAKDLKNRLARYFSFKELKITDNLIHRALSCGCL